MDGQAGALLGIVAGVLSTVSFFPQVWKAWRDKDTKAISKRMYFITVSAFCLWVAYGFVIHSMPIIVFNFLSLLLSGSILVLKLKHESQSGPTVPLSPEAAHHSR